MLKDEITPYVSGDGLVSNALVPPGMFRACDNGVLFTSLYYILLKELGELIPQDIDHYDALIKTCCSYVDDYLHRAPGDDSQDAQDDYNGAYAALIQLGLKPSFIMSPSVYRYISLWAMRAIASKNVLIRIIATPIIALTAIIIGTSCIGAPNTDTDSRIGSWLVIKGTESSWMCQIAADFWRGRLMSVYPNGMKDVFRLYFGDAHPLTKYMIKY